MRGALLIAVLLILLGAVYIFFIRKSETLAPNRGAESAGIQVTTGKIQESTDTYIIDAKYPQFGIPAIDTKIRERIGLSIETLKNDVAEYPPPPDSAVQQYEFTSTFDSVYTGPDIVSVRIVASTYTGGAHPMSVVNGQNFERASGRDITPDEAFRMAGLTLGEVAEKAKAELSRKLGGDMIAPEGADPMLDNYSTFVIDKDKITFLFQAYQVAPYAAGPQEVAFPRVR